MSQTAKLYWGEGLFLRPQHFQRQDAYHESRLHELSRSLHPYGWGVRNVRFDQQSLASGMLRPLQLSVVFPDGELYSAPDADELPAALALHSLPEQTRTTTIHLALPLLKEHGGNCSGANSDDASSRYRQDERRTPDILSDAAEADIPYLKKSVRLLSGEQSRDACVTVPLTRLRRNNTGAFEQDPDFMPPAVCIGACSGLVIALRNLLDALQAKAQALVGTHREPSRHVIEFRSGDIASFWLLHTINSAFASLAHLHQHQGLAPERLHMELARLAGGLQTFSPSYQLSDLPVYKHGEPSAGFSKLFAIIRELLDTVISERYFGIALSEVKPSFHLGHIDSQRIDERASLYLSINADMPANELISMVPTRCKVGAPDDVEKAITSALPVVDITHQPQVPAAIPVRPGNIYFSINAQGPLYERMLKAQSVMIYVPSGIPELQLELIAIAP